MRKSKHFRKDVVIARIIAALILIVLIALIVTVVSHFTKSSGNKDSQNTQSTQDVNNGNQDSEDKDTQNQNSEGQNNPSNDEPSNDEPSNDDPSNDDPSNDGSNTQQGSENDADTDVVEKVYVKTTARIRLREEPNTNCRTLEGINSGVELEVLETLDGWYKVSYNGKTGYVSADYAKIVEE